MVRLRDLGFGIGQLSPGRWNAITDVAGVRVGHTTLVEGDGPLAVGKGPIRTGVTVVQPRVGSARQEPACAGAFTLNGNGECVGLEWIHENGVLTTPIALTNTHSVGVVRDALVAYETRRFPSSHYWSMPVVAETYDGILNDIDGQHVKAQHVLDALDSAGSGPVAEGNVGGGTGMICHAFKGGIGTSSRVVPPECGGWTVGVLVQANYGRREDLRVNGVPAGQLIPADEIARPPSASTMHGHGLPPGSGSIITIVATDAPLLPGQCRRLAIRSGVGLSRVGGGASDSSGDIMLAFATGNSGIPPEYYGPETPLTYEMTVLSHQHLGPLFQAASDATEEAIVNALLAAETMTGRDGITAHELDPDRLTTVLTRYLPRDDARPVGVLPDAATGHPVDH